MGRREKYFCQASKRCPAAASRFNDNEMAYRLLSVSCFFFFFVFFLLLFLFLFFSLNILSECRMVRLQELVMDAGRPASFQRDLPNVVHTALINCAHQLR
jgi:hypothetical protein